MTKLLEGQLALLQHVHLYEENHRGVHILQPQLLWKYEFLCCFMGCLSSEHLNDLTQEITGISRLRQDFNSWSVRSSKALSAALRHDRNIQLGRYMEVSMEDSAHSHEAEALRLASEEVFLLPHGQLQRPVFHLGRPKGTGLRWVLRLGL